MMIGNRHLGAAMDLHTRKVLPDHGKQPQILYDQGIDAKGVQPGDIGESIFHFICK